MTCFHSFGRGHSAPVSMVWMEQRVPVSLVSGRHMLPVSMVIGWGTEDFFPWWGGGARHACFHGF